LRDDEKPIESVTKDGVESGHGHNGQSFLKSGFHVGGQTRVEGGKSQRIFSFIFDGRGKVGFCSGKRGN
jgi:hypothetical protein